VDDEEGAGPKGCLMELSTGVDEESNNLQETKLSCGIAIYHL
jgi:hypothetical protein